MPYSVVMVVYRNPNLTPAQFKHHYETVHVPLAESLAGDSFPLSHTRRYIQRLDTDHGHPAVVFKGAQSDFDYDCLSEMQFENEGACQAFFAKLATPESKSRMDDDTAVFMIQSKTKIVVLGEINVTTKSG